MPQTYASACSGARPDGQMEKMCLFDYDKKHNWANKVADVSTGRETRKSETKRQPSTQLHASIDTKRSPALPRTHRFHAVNADRANWQPSPLNRPLAPIRAITTGMHKLSAHFERAQLRRVKFHKDPHDWLVAQVGHSYCSIARRPASPLAGPRPLDEDVFIRKRVQIEPGCIDFYFLVSLSHLT